MSKRPYDDIETDDEDDVDRDDYPLTQRPNNAAAGYANQAQQSSANGVKRLRSTGNGYPQSAHSSVLWTGTTSKWDSSALLSSRPFAAKNSRTRRSASIARRNLVENDANNGLFNVGKKVFSWALEKMGLAPPSINMDTTDNYPAGFSFSISPNYERPLSSTSFITEDGSRYEPIDHSSRCRSRSRSRSQTPNRTGSQEEVYFTPINSPESDEHFKHLEAKDDRPPRRSILSPEPKRSSSPGNKARPRVSINRTPQVREIANRQQLAKTPHAVWEHRDLQPEECESFKHRIPGELTPEVAVEKTSYMSDLFSSASPTTSNLQLLSNLTEAEPKEALSSDRKQPPSTPPPSSPSKKVDGRRPLTEIVLSPRTETANLMIDFALQSPKASVRSQSRAGKRNLSFEQVMSLASAQQEVIETSMEMKEQNKPRTPERQKREVTVGTPSPVKYLPTIPRRHRASVVEAASLLLKIANQGKKTLLSKSVDSMPEETSAIPVKRRLFLPRLMEIRPITEPAKEDLSRFNRWPKVDINLCRPVQAMFQRNKQSSPWLPPVFEDVDDAEEDVENDGDYEFEEEEEGEEDEEEEQSAESDVFMDKSESGEESASADDHSDDPESTAIHIIETDENSTDESAATSSQPRKRRFSFEELRQKQLQTFLQNISPRTAVNSSRNENEVPLEMRDETLP